MKVCVFGETSQATTNEFLKRGHDAYSIDYLDTFGDPKRHIKGNMFDYLNEGWDLGVFHPTCTFLTVANTYMTRGCSKYTAAEAAIYRADAIADFMRIVNCNIPLYLIENPIGIMSSIYRKPDQIIQPYQFGEDASKATCLWLKGLPLLKPTQYVEPRIVDGKKRWQNQTDSGQNKLAPSADRWQLRSKTYLGIAAAIAEQYGNVKPGLKSGEQLPIFENGIYLENGL